MSMIPNELGKIRQSATLMNYGPGAIIDFRIAGSGASVSVVAAGLEQWERQAQEAGANSSDMKRFVERRLCDKLNVSHFRMPPVAPDNKGDEFPVIALVGARFPGWLQCPSCDTIMPAKKWGSNPGDPSRFCDPCSSELREGKKIYVVPVRFVLACRNGHLDDFPWFDWIHDGDSSCSNKRKLILRSEGPGLAGLILSCPKCKKRRSMEYAFKGGAHKDRRCSGGRPWLIEGQEECDLKPTTMQRGASNLYYSRFDSALVIPPWSEEIIRRLGYRWNEIETITTEEDSTTEEEHRSRYIDMFWNQIQEEIGDIGKVAFKKLVEEKIAESTRSRSGHLRWDEYRQFMVAAGQQTRQGDEFDVRVEPPPAEIPHLSHLLRVVSLREIRALKSFSRIDAYPAAPPVRLQALSKGGINWLPAIDVRGEGIFIALDSERLSQWENQGSVKSRAVKLQDKYLESRVLNPDGMEVEISASLGARYLLLHALAHVLMKQLSLQCGYSSASLRELIYAGDGDRDMAGLMIYTSTSDSDGTLGGLQRQGEPDRFKGMFIEAIRANEWCASDPLCIKGLVSNTEASSLACCHSCLLVPETSCQDFNRFLDRAMLVGTPEDRSLGFFSDLLVRGE